ncbi:MAG: response regulator [Bdellovibrionota bacterium]
MVVDVALKILSIEDYKPDQILISKAFKDRHNFALFQMDKFEKGIEAARGNRVDIVLLDLNLPDSPGNLETYKEFSRQCPNIPVVVFTSMADEQMGLQAVRLGAQDYLIKGKTSNQVLINAVQFAFERHRDELFIRTFLTQSAKPIVVLNWKNEVRWINELAEDLFHRSAAEWVGRIFDFEFSENPQFNLNLDGDVVGVARSEVEIRGEIFHVLTFGESSTTLF